MGKAEDEGEYSPLTAVSCQSLDTKIYVRPADDYDNGDYQSLPFMTDFVSLYFSC